MIVYIDGIIEKLQNGGGCTVYFSNLIKRLYRDEYDLKYFHYCKSKMELSNLNKIEKEVRIFERWRDIDIGKCPNDAIFHSTHYRLPKRRMKTITTVHDFTYELYRSGPAKWFHSWQKFRAIRKSDLVICVSENTASDLAKFCPIDPKKVRIVYNGVAPEYHPLDLKTRTNEVVFIGARGWYKNFDLAVETLKSYPELRLSIVGGGDLSNKEVQLLEASIPKRYQWMGRLSDSDLNKLYNRAHCLFYPSDYEGFGIPVLEAMKSGCPVIAVNTSSIPEVAGLAALLVDTACVSSFSMALDKLNDESIRIELITRGITQADKFSWEKCYDDTLNVYKELL